MFKLSAGLLMGILLAQTAVAQQRDGPSAKERRVAKLLEQLDKNSDGVLEGSELTEPLANHFAGLDENHDGKFSADELLKMRGRPGERAGEIVTGAASAERFEDTLKVGDPAPDFTLADPHGKKQVTLSCFQGEKPVVLMFGSYT